MTRCVIGKVLCVFVLVLCANADAVADETEVRDYIVRVNGKQVGHNQLVITDKKDGTTVVTNKAHVKVKFFITYTYDYQGTEVWRGYQLLRLEGNCNDNKDKHNVDATLNEQQNAIDVRSDSRQQSIQPNVWTTSYWKLPDAKYHNKGITLVDADRGDVIPGLLKYVGTEQIPIAGKNQKCYHFRVAGPNPAVDLWFDVYHRLVRQEFIERGYRTEIEMVNIRR